MMTRLFMAGLLAAAATPLLAQAAAPVPPRAPVAPTRPVAPMADRIVTRAEVDARIRTHFAQLDSNKDGYVTDRGNGRDARRSAPPASSAASRPCDARPRRRVRPP